MPPRRAMPTTACATGHIQCRNDWLAVALGRAGLGVASHACICVADIDTDARRHTAAFGVWWPWLHLQGSHNVV